MEMARVADDGPGELASGFQCRRCAVEPVTVSPGAVLQRADRLARIGQSHHRRDPLGVVRPYS